MGEVGCLKDGIFQNLQVEGNSILTAGTLSYKTPVFSITLATFTPKVSESGTIFTFNRAAGIVVTLPAAEPGLRYEFYVETALTSNAYTINAASAADTLTGILLCQDIADVGTNVALNEDVATIGFSRPAAADHQLSTNKTTTGGLKGSHFIYTCISAALWQVSGTNIGSSGATIATPFT